MERNDRILIASLFAAVIGLALVVLIREVGFSSTGAARVQAVGSVVAIVSASRIASRQSREAAAAAAERDAIACAENQKRAYLLTLRLGSILMDLDIRLRTASRANNSLHTLDNQIKEDVESVLAALLFQVTWDETIFDNFYLLPTKAARVTAHMLYAVARFDRETRTLLEFVASHGGDLAEAQKQFAGNYEQIRLALGDAVTLLSPIVSMPPKDDAAHVGLG